MNPLFHPRDFSYPDMPENWQEMDFDPYCAWLGDYLLKIDAPVPECQNNTWEELKEKEPLFAARILGDQAWYHCLYYVEPFDFDGHSPESYEAVYNVLKEQHEETYADEDDPDCFDKLEDWINPEIWANIVREYNQYGKVLADTADVGYRIILSKLISKADSSVKQLEVLDHFFRSYIEESLK